MEVLRGLFKSSVGRGRDFLSADQLSKKADQATKNAGLARSPLQKFSYALCNESDVAPDSSVIMGETKSVSRIIEKAVARYNGDVSKVDDVCRDMILIDDQEQLRDLRSIISNTSFRDTWEDKGVRVEKIDDMFTHPHADTGWRGMVLKVEVDLGKGRMQSAEIQIIPRAMHDIYQKTHVYLEQIRELKDNAKALNVNLSEHEKTVIAEHQAEARRMHYEGARDTGFLSPDELRQPSSEISRLFEYN